MLKTNNNILLIIIYFFCFYFLYILYNTLGPVNLNLLHEEYGVALGGDSGRYIRAAEQILLTNFPNYPEGVADINNAQGYMGYNFFLALMFLLNLNFFSISLVQIGITGIAGYCIFKIGILLWNKNIGILALLMFLFYPSIQIFNFYILTESLFINFIIIGFYLLIRNYKLYSMILGILFLSYTASIRPFGIIILPLLLVYLFMIALKFKKKKIIYFLTTLFILILIFTYFIIDYLVILLGVPELLLSGDIIWNYNSMKPPYDLSLLSLKNMGALEVVSYIFNYPMYFLNNFLTKLFWFLFRLRPFYSDLHNLFLILSSIFLYGFSIMSLFNKSRKPEAIYFMLFFIIMMTFTVLLTVVDWDARFSLPLLPFIFLFTSSGIVTTINIIFNSYLKT